MADENYFGGGASYGGGGMNYGSGYTGTGYGPGDPGDTFESGGYGSSSGSYGMGGQGGQGGYGTGQGSYGRGQGSYGRGQGSSGQSGYYGRGEQGGRWGNRQEFGHQNREGDRGYGNANDRDWWDKTSDEVSSWFGDEQAERRRRMDERQGGQFRGHGPRNYTRSDDRIKEDINDRLTDHSYLDASNIDVEVNNGEVVLSGNVDSRWAKRQAEDIAEDISGVKNVENRIRVEENTWNQNTWNQNASETDKNTSTTHHKTRGKSA